MSGVFDVRMSEIVAGQEWLTEGAWVKVTRVSVGDPDDRVEITFTEDGEEHSTTEYRGWQRAAVRNPTGVAASLFNAGMLQMCGWHDIAPNGIADLGSARSILPGKAVWYLIWDRTNENVSRYPIDPPLVLDGGDSLISLDVRQR